MYPDTLSPETVLKVLIDAGVVTEQQIEDAQAAYQKMINSLQTKVEVKKPAKGIMSVAEAEAYVDGRVRVPKAIKAKKDPADVSYHHWYQSLMATERKGPPDLRDNLALLHTRYYLKKAGCPAAELKRFNLLCESDKKLAGIMAWNYFKEVKAKRVLELLPEVSERYLIQGSIRLRHSPHVSKKVRKLLKAGQCRKAYKMHINSLIGVKE